MLKIRYYIDMMSLFTTNTIGIDLGSYYTRILLKDKGLVFEEPTIVAVSNRDNLTSIIACGEDARELAGRTIGDIDTVYPIVHGEIIDFTLAEGYISYCIKKTLGTWNFIKPDVVISISCGLSNLEKRAIEETCLRSGAKRVFLVKKPICAALGARMSIDMPEGIMIVDIGAGTVDASIVSFGGIVSSSSGKVGTLDMINSIKEYTYEKYGLSTGSANAEHIFKKGSYALHNDSDESFEIKGIDNETNLPRTIDISIKEITVIIEPHLKKIIEVIKEVLYDIPPELASDILDKGMLICGGGALINDIDELLFRRMGIRSEIINEPLRVVSKGLYEIISHMGEFVRVLSEKNRW